MIADRTPVIAGLGMTEMGRVYRPSPQHFAIEAVRAALKDAGLAAGDVDGLLISSGMSGRVPLSIAADLEMNHLNMLGEVHAFGATAGIMVAQAASAVKAGLAEVVVCVFAEAPLQAGRSAGEAFKGLRKPVGLTGLIPAAGLDSTTSLYALAARRHMLRYGTTSDDFAAVAVAQRAWAALNPLAQMGHKPLTVDDYYSTRMVADPLRLLDCCLVSNGGIAIVVTSASRATDLPQVPVYIHGYAQAHSLYPSDASSEFGLVSAAATSGPAALRMAGLTVEDVNVVQLYDCYTFTVLLTLEDYGFCGKGEAGELVRSGITAPGGSLPVNTGGGQLSAYYMWGMTPLSEAVMQARGTAGERQVDKRDVVLVSGNGGILNHHSTLVLSPHSPAKG